MTVAACSLSGLDQTGLSDFVGVNHDLREPVVAAGTVTRLALDSGESRPPGGMTTKATRGGTFDTEAIGSPGVCGRAPTHIGGAVTELAALRADEGGLVNAQTKEGRDHNEATSGERESVPILVWN